MQEQSLPTPPPAIPGLDVTEILEAFDALVDRWRAHRGVDEDDRPLCVCGDPECMRRLS